MIIFRYKGLGWTLKSALLHRIVNRPELFRTGRDLVCQNVSDRFLACIQNFSFVASYCWNNRVGFIFNKKWIMVNYFVMFTLLGHQFPAVAHVSTPSVNSAFGRKSGFKNKCLAPAGFRLQNEARLQLCYYIIIYVRNCFSTSVKFCWKIFSKIFNLKHPILLQWLVYCTAFFKNKFATFARVVASISSNHLKNAATWVKCSNLITEVPKSDILLDSTWIKLTNVCFLT